MLFSKETSPGVEPVPCPYIVPLVSQLVQIMNHLETHTNRKRTVQLYGPATTATASSSCWYTLSSSSYTEQENITKSRKSSFLYYLIKDLFFFKLNLKTFHTQVYASVPGRERRGSWKYLRIVLPALRGDGCRRIRQPCTYTVLPNECQTWKFKEIVNKFETWRLRVCPNA